MRHTPHLALVQLSAEALLIASQESMFSKRQWALSEAFDPHNHAEQAGGLETNVTEGRASKQEPHLPFRDQLKATGLVLAF